jgi:multidrug efflux pump subunit AcrB
VKLASEQHKVKSQNWVAYFIEKPLLSFACFFNYFNNLDFIRNRILPEMDEGSIVLDYESPPGTSLEETDRMLVEVEKSYVISRKWRPIAEERVRKWAFLRNPIGRLSNSAKRSLQD